MDGASIISGFIGSFLGVAASMRSSIQKDRLQHVSLPLHRCWSDDRVAAT
jgi:hypothetical protein